MSPASRSLALRLARFGVAFAIMVAPWPGLGAAFVDCVGTAVTAIANPLTASSNVTLALRLPKAEEAQPDWKGVVSVREDLPEGTRNHAGALDLRRAGYLQLATFVALAAAWPPRGRGRWCALSAAATVVSISIALPLLAFLASAGVLSSHTLLALASRTLIAAPCMAFAIPGLVWLAVSPGRWLDAAAIHAGDGRLSGVADPIPPVGPVRGH